MKMFPTTWFSKEILIVKKEQAKYRLALKNKFI